MNRVAYVVDATGSMKHRAKQTKALVMSSIKRLDADDRVTVVTFEDTQGVQVPVSDVDARDVRDFKYSIGGMTNLLDAVSATCKMLTKGRKDTFTVVVLTDGSENASRTTPESLRSELDRLQATDKWTFAWMVPPDCVATTVALGVDASNVFAWTDIEEAATALTGGMVTLAKAKLDGKTALRSGFFADLSGVAKKDVRKEMTPVTLRRALVTKKQSIKSFCMKAFGEFEKGSCFYELTMPETVQGYKEVAVIDKRRPTEIFIGGRGILGLPDGTVRLKPGDLGNYRVFVGSTSVNRNMDPGTEALYGKGMAKI